MKNLKKNLWGGAVSLLVGLGIFSVSTTTEARRGMERKTDKVAVISNHGIKGKLNVAGNKQEQSVSGRVAINLSTSGELLPRGVFTLQDLNVIINDVDQRLLVKRRRVNGPKKGTVGFKINRGKNGRGHSIAFDKRKRRFKGSFQGKISFPHLAKQTSRRPRNPKHDSFDQPEQDGIVDVVIDLGEEIAGSVGEKVETVQATMVIQIKALAIPKHNIHEYIIRSFRIPIFVQIVSLRYFQLARELCVQPVSVRSGSNDNNPTGAGLSFGRPGADLQWGKAGVVFDWQPLMHVTNADLKTPDSDSKEDDLRSRVNSADCVEVFFVESFSPESKYGGGATWGSGSAEAKIISSDGNANGIDFTHLAHELGHAIGLVHPGTGAPNALRPNVTDGSTGTLMCGSGWQNDNPPVNSQENADNVSNPLITFSYRLIRQSADCEDSADCGACF